MWNQPPWKASRVAVSVLQVALHHDVAAEHDLAHGLAVGRHRLHRLGVEHRHAFLQRVAHALAAVQPRPLADQSLPSPGCLAQTAAGP